MNVVSFYTDNSEQSRLIEDELKQRNISYRRFLDFSRTRILPMIDGSEGIYTGEGNIRTYYFTE